MAQAGTVGDAARRKLRQGDGSFARDHIRAVAQRVEMVSKTEVRIRGLCSELLRTLTAASGVEAAVLGVRAFELKWRARDDEDENWLIVICSHVDRPR